MNSEYAVNLSNKYLNKPQAQVNNELHLQLPQKKPVSPIRKEGTNKYLILLVSNTQEGVGLSEKEKEIEKEGESKQELVPKSLVFIMR